MMRRLLIAASVALLPLAAAGQAKFELETRLWQPDLTSSVRSVEGAEEIDPDLAIVDLKDDLGVKDDDFLDYRLTVFTGPRSRIRFGYTSIDYAGDATVTRTIEFQGTTYELGTRVVSDLTMDYYRLGWTWQFLGGRTARFGTILEAKAVEIDAGLLAPEIDPPVDERDSISAVFPTVGLALDVNPSRRVSLFAEVSGIDVGDTGNFLDGEVGLRVTPVPFLTLVGGWRMIDMEVKDNEDFAKLEDSGPFFGATLRF